MPNHLKQQTESNESEFSEIAKTVYAMAQSYRGDPIALLGLLRLLEHLHRDICDSLFQESLPGNRQALYGLLREMEAQGGWPYIQRMKLQTLLTHLTENNSTAEPEVLSDSSV